jgi:hypothetical protein
MLLQSKTPKIVAAPFIKIKKIIHSLSQHLHKKDSNDSFSLQHQQTNITCCNNR